MPAGNLPGAAVSYNTAEISDYAGKPVELFRFAHGVSVWRHTSGDVPVTGPDGSYTPEAIIAESISRGREWNSGGQDITVDYLHPVAQLFAGDRPREPVGVTVYSMHRGETDLPVKFIGEIQGVKFAGRSVVISCVPYGYRFKKKLPWLRYSSRCPLALYSARCGVVRESYRLRVVVTGVTVAVLDSASFASEVDGWWTGGYVQTLEGETRGIIDHAGTAITLEYPLDVEAGQTIDVFAGCDKALATCRDKFVNVANHLGFHLIPTRDLFGPSIE